MSWNFDEEIQAKIILTAIKRELTLFYGGDLYPTFAPYP